VENLRTKNRRSSSPGNHMWREIVSFERDAEHVLNMSHSYFQIYLPLLLPRRITYWQIYGTKKEGVKLWCWTP